MRNWEIGYRLQPVGGKYFFRRVEAKYQHEANAIFDAEMQVQLDVDQQKYLGLFGVALTTLERNKKNNRN